MAHSAWPEWIYVGVVIALMCWVGAEAWEAERLVEHVSLFGENKFVREIVHLCKTKGEMTYYETKHIFAVDAVLSEKYYNDWV